MLYGLVLLMLVLDAPLAPPYEPKYEPVRLRNGVVFRPSPEGFAFVKGGKVLKRYRYEELGGVPESPSCKEPYVEDFGNGVVFVGYCIFYEGPETAGGYVGCYFTEEGEKKWCASGEFTGWPALDSLGRYFVGYSYMWEGDPIHVFTPDKHIVLEGRGVGVGGVLFMDSGIVFRFWGIPQEVADKLRARYGNVGPEIVVLLFSDEGVLVGDTFFVDLPPGYIAHRAEIREGRVEVWFRDMYGELPPRSLEVSLQPWDGDTVRIPEVR